MTPENICVISFDHWNYDHHIVKTLNKMGHNSRHIKFGDYKHKSIKDKITNTLSKVFTGKNLKKIRRQDYILEQLKNIGKQDKILVINPEVISLEHHLKIKTYSTEYIAYLYDSVSRNPIKHLLNGVFDTIFSFDKNDIETYHFKATSNYIYLPKNNTKTTSRYDVVYLGSLDDRVPKLVKILSKLQDLNINFKAIVVGNNKALNKLKEDHKDLISFTDKALTQDELITFYKKSKIIIDLIRDEQTGLSFRFFEALALEKKIITNNKNSNNYEFFNPGNIAVIDDTINIDQSFFKTNYKPIPEDIYQKFTLEHWVKQVFKL